MTPGQQAAAAAEVARDAARSYPRGSIWRAAATTASVALSFGSVAKAKRAVVEHFADTDPELCEEVLSEITAAVAAAKGEAA